MPLCVYVYGCVCVCMYVCMYVQLATQLGRQLCMYSLPPYVCMYCPTAHLSHLVVTLQHEHPYTVWFRIPCHDRLCPPFLRWLTTHHTIPYFLSGIQLSVSALLLTVTCSLLT